ncbi:MAG: SDR family NAD(P)-dependent oxidoreductase, partial [Pseudomonadota bacterium]|nr:SDR family NAD(P)-dependent oxidoreductase [Pseudomonadota bacterium]
MVVLIVGASGGIWQALAENYASAGHNVIGTFFNTTPKGLSEKIELTPMDPTNETSVQNTLSKIYSLDLVINCVGFLSSDGGLPEKTIRKFEPHGLEESIRVNTLPTLLVAKHAQRLLRQ